MAAQNLVVVTRKVLGTKFQVSTTKIIKFKGQSQGTDTLLSYIDQRGQATDLLVDETPAAVNALTGGRTQAVTLDSDGSTLYINSDNIIYLDTTTFGCRITYNISGSAGKYRQPPTFIDVTETPGSINTAAGNTGIITFRDGSTRWIDGNSLDLVAKDPSPLNSAGFAVLYDDKKVDFNILHVNSSGNAFSIGSGL